jgi:hypothetical protein
LFNIGGLLPSWCQTIRFTRAHKKSRLSHKSVVFVATRKPFSCSKSSARLIGTQRIPNCQRQRFITTSCCLRRLLVFNMFLCINNEQMNVLFAPAIVQAFHRSFVPLWPLSRTKLRIVVLKLVCALVVATPYRCFKISVCTSCGYYLMCSFSLVLSLCPL